LKPKSDAIAMVMLVQFYQGGAGTVCYSLKLKIKITKIWFKCIFRLHISYN